MRLSTIHVAWHQGAELRRGRGEAGLPAVATRTRPSKMSTAANACRLETPGEDDSWCRWPYRASGLTYVVGSMSEPGDVRCLGLNWQGLGRRV